MKKKIGAVKPAVKSLIRKTAKALKRKEESEIRNAHNLGFTWDCQDSGTLDFRVNRHEDNPTTHQTQEEQNEQESQF